MLPSSLSAITSFTPEDLTRTLVIGSLVLLVSVAAVRLANKSGLPTLLLYLGIGLILGEAGLGIQFSDPRLTQVFGYSALALILAEGGLTTSWSSIRRSVAPAAVLSTVGVLVSIAVVGVAAHYLLNLNWQVAFLLGAITSSTDAAAVFSVLRRVPLPHRLTGVLEAESGFNDAPVVLIVVALAEGAAHRNESPWWVVVIEASLELVGGAAIGLAIGWAGSWIGHRVTATSSALFSLAVLSLTVLAYGVADLAHTSGFIAAYLCALVIGNQRLPHRQATRSFAQALGWLAQIGLFVMLGLLASPKRLMDQLVPAIVIGVVLLLLARPLSVLVSLTPFRFTPREMAFLSWAGLRGAVPVVLATVPLTVGTPDTGWIFDLVFVLVVVFTIVQAPTLPWLARRLRIATTAHTVSVEVESTPLDELHAELLQVRVGPESKLNGVEIHELRLPAGAAVTLIVRDGTSAVPGPNTVLRHGDELLVVATAGSRNATLRRIQAVSAGGRLAGWRKTPPQRS